MSLFNKLNEIRHIITSCVVEGVAALSACTYKCIGPNIFWGWMVHLGLLLLHDYVLLLHKTFVLGGGGVGAGMGCVII